MTALLLAVTFMTLALLVVGAGIWRELVMIRCNRDILARWFTRKRPRVKKRVL